MRHETSLDPAYFTRLYTEDSDPWKFETSAYERAKYEQTLAFLPAERFHRALEIGCANGALTERLAPRCDALIGVDVVDAVLARARRRCAHLPGVTIRNARIPRDQVAGPFDLILLSEVAYYWDSDDLAEAARYLTEATAPDGYLLLVHWTGETDYPKSGDDAVEELWRLAHTRFTVARAERRAEYRLDLWRRASKDQADNSKSPDAREERASI
jgi:predicted TPR repeat methyltransferase